MTTPTRSMARMAHSPPSPPPSTAGLGLGASLFPSLLLCSVAGHSVRGHVDAGCVLGQSCVMEKFFAAKTTHILWECVGERRSREGVKREG